ncbi:uncharacterized protein LOC130285434 isoform X2 [Hyla sarda]|uniref:uncharacterized protein LOC130285434 isoform X2 n=1 Tax=Hyla sarda TaxID=327740 RepID=UPI0024C33EC1|nr:uncharacterized protein LOC130285434 isoform X2 [Hyla sarda]
MLIHRLIRIESESQRSESACYFLFSVETMAASHQDLILSTLQELGKESFKRFKVFLRDKELLESLGYSPVSLVHLEDKDCVDVAERLISHYTRDGALRVTGIILEKINEKQLAEHLRTCSYANPLTNTINILASSLNRLSKDRFEAFIRELCRLRAPRGYNQIQREHLKGKSPMKVSEIIINSYTKRLGPAKVKQALGNINENQIRIDLEKELKANFMSKASWTSCGKISVAHQKPNVGALKNVTTLKTPTENAQPMGGPTGCTLGKSQQPGEDIKPEIGSHPITAAGIGDGEDRSADQKQIVGTGPRTKTLKKPNVNAQPKGSPAGHKPRKSRRPAAGIGDREDKLADQKQNVGTGTRTKTLKKPKGPGEDIKPKTGSDPTGQHLHEALGAPQTGSGEIHVVDQKMNVGVGESWKTNVQPLEDSTGCKPGKSQLLAPETGGGQVNGTDQKANVGARKSSKPPKKLTGKAQPTGGPTRCTTWKGQQLGEDRNPEIRRKPITEPKISGGAADYVRGMEELSIEDVKPKRREHKTKTKGNT